MSKHWPICKRNVKRNLNLCKKREREGNRWVYHQCFASELSSGASGKVFEKSWHRVGLQTLKLMVLLSWNNLHLIYIISFHFQSHRDFSLRSVGYRKKWRKRNKKWKNYDMNWRIKKLKTKLPARKEISWWEPVCLCNFFLCFSNLILALFWNLEPKEMTLGGRLQFR